jgi:hypothetical protein
MVLRNDNNPTAKQRNKYVLSLPELFIVMMLLILLVSWHAAPP